jgi:hypothetical protein
MRAGLADTALGSAMLGAALLSAAGCSSGGGSAASSPSPSPSAAATTAVCRDVAALRTSINELGHISASPNALGKLKTDVANVKANLAQLHSTAGTEWRAQINALNAALSKLQKTLANLGSQPSAPAAAKAVSTDLAAVTTAGSNLLRTASTRCPAASASPS